VVKVRWRMHIRGVCDSAGTDAGEVKCVGAEANKQGGVLLAMDAAPALTEGTASIEPASGAERATTAKSSLLEPGAYSKACYRPQLGGASHEAEMSLQGGTEGHKVLRRKYECENDDRKPEAQPPRVSTNSRCLSREA
jgi:hypothetical protein